MSSHHSEECFNLHHDQVNASKARKLKHHTERLQNFLGMRKQLRMEYDCMRSFGFVCFAYTMLATPVYLKYVLNHLGITPAWGV